MKLSALDYSIFEQLIDLVLGHPEHGEKSRRALLKLPAIESLSIKNAKLKSMSGLKKLKSLRFLALPNNRISTLALEVVHSLTSLQFLSLRCNRIKTISQAVLDLLKQRRLSLNLDLNHIKDVNPIRALLGEKVEGLDSQRE